MDTYVGMRVANPIANRLQVCQIAVHQRKPAFDIADPPTICGGIDERRDLMAVCQQLACELRSHKPADAGQENPTRHGMMCGDGAGTMKRPPPSIYRRCCLTTSSAKFQARSKA